MLLDFITQTTQFINEVEQTSMLYGLPPDPLVQYEMAASRVAANNYLETIGGIDHYFTQQGRDIACTLMQWNGYNCAAGTHEWTIRADGQIGTLDVVGGTLLEELRKKHDR